MLSQQHRIVTGDDYRQIVRTGKRINCATSVLHVKTTDIADPARFGFIITKSVGKAHTRNLIRRRYKAVALDLIRAGLCGKDIVVRVHPRSAITTFAELKAQLFACVELRQLETLLAQETAS